MYAFYPALNSFYEKHITREQQQRKYKSVKSIFALIVSSFVIAACSSHLDGSEYIGKWKDKSGHVSELVMDGHAIFLVTCGTKVPAIYNKDNNTLQVGQIYVSYSKKSDSIFDTKGRELQRFNGTISVDEHCGPKLLPMPTAPIVKP